MTTETCSRFDFAATAPAAFRAVLALDKSWRAHLDPALVELVQIRVSQINGCAYCLHLHTSDALERGESALRVSMVPVWREARHFFSDSELAALELAEELTRMGEEAVSDSAYARALEIFGEQGLGHLLAQILTINTWNRIARATGKVAGTDERRT